MEISAQLVKQLRERTGAGMMECKSALVEAKGDLAEAEVVLRKKGIASAAKKSTRSTKQGVIGSYIHPGAQLGVLIEVNCESDFVARTDDFQELVHDLAMQVAAADPQFIRKEDVTAGGARQRARHPARPRAGRRQAREDARQDRRRPHEQVLRRGLPVRAALHQGKHHHHRRSDQDQDRQAGREHFGVALRALQGGRHGVRPIHPDPRQPRPSSPCLRYRRILLKLSGEVLAGEGSFGIDPARVQALAEEVAEVARTGVQIGLVVGGGNFFRGVAAAAQNMDRVAADHMGMLATVINALALQDALEKAGRADARDDRHRDARGGRAVHPPPGDPASGKRPHRDLRGGHFESLFFDRHRGDAARPGNPRRGGRQGHARRRRLR